MGWRPSFEGERPTLGWEVLDWFEDNLVVPDGPSAGEPLVLTNEQAQFVLGFYEVDPSFEGEAVVGRSLRAGRMVRRAVLSRPKGWGKSPLLAAVCLFEAVGPAVFDGWNADGQPVGRPWSSLGFKAQVQIVAVTEDQTANTWMPLLEMAREGPIADHYRIDAFESMVNVPNGIIEPVTSSGTSREGYRAVFCAMDQTESWVPSNGGVKLAATLRRNLGKVQGSSIETPNAYVPGTGSVAESSWDAWEQQQQGHSRIDHGLLYDHREAPGTTDIYDEVSLREGLAFAYGESADVNGGWVSLDRILQEFWDADTSVQDARGFYLNQRTHAETSFVSQPAWAGCVDATKVVADRDEITLGFDGSGGRRSTHKPDATALIGCRVSDGHLFEIGVWEVSNRREEWQDWEPPFVAIEAALADTFRRYAVKAFYADPGGEFGAHMKSWEGKYAADVPVKASSVSPFWWSMRKTALWEMALESFESAVRHKQLTHDGSFALTNHMINARRHIRGGKLTIGKEDSNSPNKMDATVAAVLAFLGRNDVMSKGLAKAPRRSAVFRIR